MVNKDFHTTTTFDHHRKMHHAYMRTRGLSVFSCVSNLFSVLSAFSRQQCRFFSTNKHQVVPIHGSKEGTTSCLVPRLHNGSDRQTSSRRNSLMSGATSCTLSTTSNPRDMIHTRYNPAITQDRFSTFNDDIYSGIDQHNVTALVSLDISAAFDMVNHIGVARGGAWGA